MRRPVEALAAFVVGGVLIGPIGAVLTYATGVLDPDGYGPARVVAGTGAIAILAFGTAYAFALPPGVRGWPAAAVALGAVLFLGLAGSSEVGPASHALIRLAAALAAGVALGSVAAAVLAAGPSVEPAGPAAGPSVEVLSSGPPDRLPARAPVPAARWTTAALAAGMFTGLDRLLVALGFRPGFIVFDDGRVDHDQILVVVAAAVAALVTRDRRPAAAPPGTVGAVTVVTAVGAVLTSPFHSGFVERAAIHRGSALYLGVALTAALWAGAVAVLVRWAGRRAGPTAARFALAVAGGAAALSFASIPADVEDHRWIPILAVALGVLGAVAGVRRPGARIVAAGLVAVSLLGAGLIVTVDRTTAGSTAVVLFMAVLAGAGAFTMAALLASSRANDVPYGVAALLVSAPVLYGVIVFVRRLDELGGGPPLGQLTGWTPVWVAAIGVAVVLVRLRWERPAVAVVAD